MKSTNKKITLLWSLLCVLVVFSLFANSSTLLTENITNNQDFISFNYDSLDDESNPEVAKSWNNFTFIHIKNNWTAAKDLGWVKGTGNEIDPFIIENITINAKENIFGILIEDSRNAFFEIRNCTVYNQTESSESTEIRGGGIVLLHTNRGKLVDCNVYDSRRGISLFNASNNWLENNTLDDCGVGVVLYGGLQFPWIINCYNNTLKGNNLTGCGLTTNFLLKEAVSQNIDTTNRANQKSIYYYANKTHLYSNAFNEPGQIILHFCNDSYVSNIEILNATNGIIIKDCLNITINNCNSSNNVGMGIYCNKCENISIIHSKLENNDELGLELYSSNYCNISLNTIFNSKKGIEISSSFNNIILNNTMVKCGIVIEDSYSPISSNTINSSNTVNGKPVIYFEDKNNLDTNNFTGAGQIILINCNNSKINDFDFHLVSGGIAVFESKDISVINNNVSLNFYYGINIIECKNVTIYNNIANDCKYGYRIIETEILQIINCSAFFCFDIGCYLIQINYINMTNCKFNYNGKDGFYFDYVNNGRIFNVTAYNNTNNGFSFYGNENKITNSTFYNNYNGIYMEYSDNNNITNCLISNNTKYGAYLNFECDDNLWYNNTFVNNGLYNAYDVSTNYWNGTLIGNYWDDYSGYDSNDDGMGDSGFPYNVPGGSNKDEKPIFWDAPVITIYNPSNGTPFGKISPLFYTVVSEGISDRFWYSLNSSVNTYNYTGITHQINQTEWNTFGNGSITIHFYVNDSRGWMGYADAIVGKDIIAPTVIINNPHNNDLFGKIAPNSTTCNVNFYDSNGISIKWYMLINGTNSSDHTDNYTWNNEVDLYVWDQMENGTVIIRIFANDSVGNTGFDEIILRKDVIGPTIIIYDPFYNELFTNSAPTGCSTDINDINGVDKQWYMLINGTNSNDYTINRTWNNFVHQDIWDEMDNGTVIIRIFANDSLNNIGFNEVLVRKDIESITITITNPVLGDMCGKSAPEFTLQITGSSCDKLWYMLINTTNLLDYTNNFTYPLSIDPGQIQYSIEQSLWELMDNGSVIIRFFLNKTTGVKISEEVIVRKDVIKPNITIILPHANQTVYRTSPNFAVYFDEINNDTYRYRLFNATHYSEYFTFYSNGTINKEIWEVFWDAIPVGKNITIIFYCNDTAGNFAFSNITVIKGLQEVPLLPSGGDDDNGDSKKTAEGFDFVKFVSSPIGIGVVGGSAAGGVATAIFLKKRVSGKRKLKEINQIKKIRKEIQ